MSLNAARTAITNYSRHLEENTFVGRGLIYYPSEVDQACQQVMRGLIRNARNFWCSAKQDDSKLQKLWKYPVAVLSGIGSIVMGLIDIFIVKIAKNIIWAIAMLFASVEHGIRYAANSKKGIGDYSDYVGYSESEPTYRQATTGNLHQGIDPRESNWGPKVRDAFPVYQQQLLSQSADLDGETPQ